MSGRVWRSERAGQGIVPVLPRDDPIAGQLVPNNCLSAAPLVRPLRGTELPLTALNILPNLCLSKTG